MPAIDELLVGELRSLLTGELQRTYGPDVVTTPLHQGVVATPFELDCSGSSFTGLASFARCTFPGRVRFARTTFSAGADFTGSTFTGPAEFPGARFPYGASFAAARFDGPAVFEAAAADGDQFAYPVEFGIAHDEADEPLLIGRGTSDRRTPPPYRADFTAARFNDAASFDRAVWHGHHGLGRGLKPSADFSGSVFERGVRFVAAAFATAARFVDTVFNGTVSFVDAEHTRYGDAEFVRTRFAYDVALGRTGKYSVTFREIHWTGPGQIDIGDACVALTQCVIAAPLTIARGSRDRVPAVVELFGSFFRAASGAPPRRRPTGRLDQLSHCTVMSPVTIAGCSLADTSFIGSTGLDQLRFPTPPGWRRLPWIPHRRPRPSRRDGHTFTWFPRGTPKPSAKSRGRQILADDWNSSLADKWDRNPGEIELLYRQLRVGLEASKAAPAAADFYYGELDARRRAARRWSADWWLLPLYRWVGGYGLRVGPPLTWLLALLFGTTALVWQRTDWYVRSSAHRVLDGYRLDAFWEALAFVTRNSISFLAAPATGLTASGTLLFVFGRYLSLTLLALAVVAVRSRVQR